jgi:ATP-dependent protease ClpP protease subunit
LYEAMKFDTFLSAAEAVEYGLADKVIEKRA